MSKLVGVVARAHDGVAQGMRVHTAREAEGPAPKMGGERQQMKTSVMTFINR